MSTTQAPSGGRLEQRQDHSIADPSFVRCVSDLFASACDLDELCPAVFDLVEPVLPASHFLIHLTEPESGRTELRAGRGPDIESGELSWARELADAAAKSREPIWLAGGESRPAAREAGAGGPIRSLLSCPLAVRGEVLGVLQVWDARDGVLGREEARVLAPVAELAAHALHHAHACMARVEHGRNLEAFVWRETWGVDDARTALIRQHHIAALGRLAPSIAHEVNDPISYMISNLRHALKAIADLEAATSPFTALLAGARALPASSDRGVAQLGRAEDRAALADSLHQLRSATEDLRELMPDVLEGMERIRSIAEELRGFARGTADGMAPTDLNRIVETALQIVRADAKDRIEFELRLAKLPKVRCYRYQVAHLLLNLLQNSVEALEGRGTVCVTTRVAAPWVDVEVSDDGPGIPGDQLDRIFEPFHSTKVGATGLGLAISRNIANAHGGTLETTNRGGAAFRLRLPIVGPTDSSPPAPMCGDAREGAEGVRVSGSARLGR